MNQLGKTVLPFYLFSNTSHLAVHFRLIPYQSPPDLHHLRSLSSRDGQIILQELNWLQRAFGSIFLLSAHQPAQISRVECQSTLSQPNFMAHPFGQFNPPDLPPHTKNTYGWNFKSHILKEPRMKLELKT